MWTIEVSLLLLSSSIFCVITFNQPLLLLYCGGGGGRYFQFFFWSDLYWHFANWLLWNWVCDAIKGWKGQIFLNRGNNNENDWMDKSLKDICQDGQPKKLIEVTMVEANQSDKYPEEILAWNPLQDKRKSRQEKVFFFSF